MSTHDGSPIQSTPPYDPDDLRRVWSCSLLRLPALAPGLFPVWPSPSHLKEVARIARGFGRAIRLAGLIQSGSGHSFPVGSVRAHDILSALFDLRRGLLRWHDFPLSGWDSLSAKEIGYCCAALRGAVRSVAHAWGLDELFRSPGSVAVIDDETGRETVLAIGDVVSARPTGTAGPKVPWYVEIVAEVLIPSPVPALDESFLQTIAVCSVEFERIAQESPEHLQVLAFGSRPDVPAVQAAEAGFRPGRCPGGPISEPRRQNAPQEPVCVKGKKPSANRARAIRSAIRTANQPLQAKQIVKALHAGKGSALRAQLSWMVNDGSLVKVPDGGYWLANEPAPNANNSSAA